ncbi:uncharacterized protein DUF222 [Jatrophihabitans sp. GAS493]|uniref:HNH endonuclease signature motif containing protein n=1 Tax=Jatrophihabitans sp. GAS493 TaxID=1907575 RepID=UPI000BB7ED41|nr:HNH endonuclease signature motif containing protein [Jatrophihabitans sp. GAS493]SOD74241.1 uncharacterized protein DUF222 [Jatrophihabitans sp. GAS493]
MDDDSRDPADGALPPPEWSAASLPQGDAVELGEPFCDESIAGLLDDSAAGSVSTSGSLSVLHGSPTTVLDVLAAPDAFARHFAHSDPDPADLALLSILDPCSLSPAGRIDLLTALRRQSGAVTAAITEDIAVVQERLTEGVPSQEMGRECANAEISTALMISPRVAANELSRAAQLVTKLPGALDLLKRGVITERHTTVLARETIGITDRSVLAAVEKSVLPRAADQTPQLFARSVKRAVLKHNRVTAEQQHQDALAKRTVEHTPRPDGMAEIWALLPAEDAAAVMTAVRALGWHKHAEDSRTADQRRADAFSTVFVDALNTPGRVPTQHGLRPSIQVTVAVTTLMGANDLPGELDGHGPIPASVARRIAADPTGTWRRLLTEPATGELLEYGRTRYTPPQDLADFVIARDQICSFPTCNVSAKQSDLDHRVPFPQGPTNKANIDPKCRRHHCLKHQTHWQTTVTRDATGTHYEWRSPTGHIYRNHTPPIADPDANDWEFRGAGSYGPPADSPEYDNPEYDDPAPF